MHPELKHADNIDETLYALLRAAQEAWEAIDNGILYQLATTIKDRVDAIIKAER